MKCSLYDFYNVICIISILMWPYIWIFCNK